jgi:hypothetical protein
MDQNGACQRINKCKEWKCPADVRFLRTLAGYRLMDEDIREELRMEYLNTV